MSEENKFYVYVHRYTSGPKKGEVFYVGKGSGNRAWHLHRRYNPHWTRVNDKYGTDVCIYLRFKSEVCAFSFEKVLISSLKRKGVLLTNISEGGPSGSCGYIPTEETRIKISKALKGIKRVRTKEQIEKHRMAISGRPLTEDHKKKISESGKGKGVVPVKTECGLLFDSLTSAKDFIVNNVNARATHQNISACCRGKIKSAYGYKWRYA